MKCTHKGLDYSLVPPLWKVFELLNIITNAGNLFCCVGIVPKFVPQPVIQNILVDCGADSNTERTSKTSAQICKSY
jgi:hypothetical protein